MRIATVSSSCPFTITDSDWNIKGFFDFNGDSKSDILWENISTKKTVVYLMDGGTLSSAGTIYSNGPLWNLLIPMDK